tara:strand:- start:190 stop:753 length:564 start_codon:yes stop_codon:yes gene_type:complete
MKLNEKFNDAKWRRGLLNEDSFDSSKMFDNSTVKKIAADIKKMVKFKDGYNASFSYSEYRFGDKTGGFSFKWNHSRHKGGSFGMGLRKGGNHVWYCHSYYDKKHIGPWNGGSGEKLPVKLKGNPIEWPDMTNDHLVSLWNKAKPMISKNEKVAQKYLDAEAKAQSDYYGKKSDTGRIGYGLSSQPRR